MDLNRIDLSRISVEPVTGGGDAIALRAVCADCGGGLTRQPTAGGWNLADLIDAMGSHVAGNHPERDRGPAAVDIAYGRRGL